MKLNSLAEVVRLDENQPANKKAQYFRRTRDGKQILRDTMRRYLPEYVVSAEKQGFSAPDASWFRGQSIEYLRRLIYGADTRLYEFVDAATIRSLVDDHLQGRENRRLLIWSLLSLEHWCENFLNDQPIDAAVIEGAPFACASSLPVKAIVARLRELGIPAALSLSAGSYVCNQVFFALVHALATRLPAARGGFVHLPWLPEQAAVRPGQPSMALPTMIDGVRAAIECALATPEDLHLAAGSMH
jgi:hypothetical protein